MYVPLHDQKKSFMNNKRVGDFCKFGTKFSRYACGSNAYFWRGRGKVQYGPYSKNRVIDILNPTAGSATGTCHLDGQYACKCTMITVECREGDISFIVVRHSNLIIQG